MTLEHIRVVGVVVALLLAAYGVSRYGRGGWRKFDLLLALAIASGVAAISLFPQVGEVFAVLFDLNNRAFALLSVSILILFGLFLYLLGQVRLNSRRNGDLVSALAVREYRERYGDLSGERDGERDGERGSDVSGERGTLMIVVPAYNEEGGMAAVLSRVPREVLGLRVRVVVVDDGSSDATVDIARRAGVPVVSHVVNRGQGDALRTGFAIARQEGAEVVINLDADGQYRPEEMDRLVRPILDDEADYVHGSRFMGHYEEAGGVRHIGVVFFSNLLSILSGKKITDCTNGFRAIRGSLLHKLDLREESFSATELILEGLKNRLRFMEVPVTMLKRSEGESKKPPSLAYPFGVFRVILRTWLR